VRGVDDYGVDDCGVDDYGVEDCGYGFSDKRMPKRRDILVNDVLFTRSGSERKLCTSTRALYIQNAHYNVTPYY